MRSTGTACGSTACSAITGSRCRRAPRRTPLRRADVAIVFVDANNTARAAETLAGLLAPDGFAVTFQNGIGNVEKLQAALGAERVLGGSSMCSAASRGPGHVTLTHMGTTSVGETQVRAARACRR